MDFLGELRARWKSFRELWNQQTLVTQVHLSQYMTTRSDLDPLWNLFHWMLVSQVTQLKFLLDFMLFSSNFEGVISLKSRKPLQCNVTIVSPCLFETE
jgi:hypothetical protein